MDRLRLKKREPTVIFMEILAALLEEPRGPTRLAQACNVNYGRIDNFTKPLEERGLIRRENSGGQEVFIITDAGYRLYQDWLEVWRRLPLEMTSSQQGFYGNRESGVKVD